MEESDGPVEMEWNEDEIDVEEGMLSPLDLEYPTLLEELRKSGFVDESDEGDVVAMLITLSVSYDVRQGGTVGQLVARTAGGRSLCVNVYGWSPHLTVQAPAGWVAGLQAESLSVLLEYELKDRLHETPEGEKIRSKLRVKRLISQVPQLAYCS